MIIFQALGEEVKAANLKSGDHSSFKSNLKQSFSHKTQAVSD